MNPIIYIVKNIISKEVRESTYVEKCLKDIIERSDFHTISMVFNESAGCSGESNYNKITLGIEYLLGLWSLCFDYHTPACEINVYQYSKTFKNHTDLLYWTVCPWDRNNHGDFQQEIHSNGLSIENCDSDSAYLYFENALWFSFLHELGHVYKGHKKENPIEEEKEADSFAIMILKEEISQKPSATCIKKESILLNLIYILFHEKIEDWNTDHSMPIQRICDVLEQLESDEKDEIWEIAFYLIKYWHRTKQTFFDASVLPTENIKSNKDKVYFIYNAVKMKLINEK